MANALTIFHPESKGGELREAIVPAVGGWELVLLPLSGRSMELMIARAERRGPVIVVVSDEGEAEKALASSADEVILVDQLDRQAVEGAIRRATARAQGMERREARAANDRRQLSASTLEALLGGACLQVEVALSRATEQCALLQDLVSQAGAIGRSIDDISGSLREAVEIASRVKALLVPTGASHIDLREVLVEIVALVRPAVETIAEFVVNVPEERCIVRLPRWQAIQAIGGLLTNAVGAARERGGSDRFIHVRLVREHDDAAVEVSDDGVGLAEHEVRALLEGTDDAALITPSLVRLAFASSVARQGKGELLINSGPTEGTTARMYIALAEAV